MNKFLTYTYIELTSVFVKYCFVSALNAVLSYAIYVLLIKIGLNYLFALIGDYVFGIIAGFIIKKNAVFRTKGNIKNEVLKYLFVYALLFAVNLILLFYMIDYNHIGANLSQFIVLFIIVAVSFIIHKFWTFNNKKR